MAGFKGLLYVKQAAVGSKSEGPVYYLQTKDREYTLIYGERHPWELDYKLEFFVRSLVKIEGEVVKENQIQVKDITEIGKGGLLP